MSTPRNKKEGFKWPSMAHMVLVFAFGFVMPHMTYNALTFLYISAIFTLVGLPMLIIAHEDKAEMQRTEKLVRELEGHGEQ